MSQPKKHVVFDIVGTCVSFDAFYSAIEAIIGPKLRQNTITAQHFGFTWQTAAEIEFTFFSICGTYKPYKELLRGFFYRTLSLCGVKDPESIFTNEERDKCVEGYSALQMRPGTHEAFQILRDNGFTIWALTTGDVQRVSGYFERAKLHMPLENLVSCDSVGVAKPAAAAYKVMWDKLGENDIKWFAAGHMWDIHGATRVGFRGAWTAEYEHNPCLDVFKEANMEVVEKTLVDMAKAIVFFSKEAALAWWCVCGFKRKRLSNTQDTETCCSLPRRPRPPTDLQARFSLASERRPSASYRPPSVCACSITGSAVHCVCLWVAPDRRRPASAALKTVPILQYWQVLRRHLLSRRLLRPLRAWETSVGSLHAQAGLRQLLLLCIVPLLINSSLLSCPPPAD